MSYLKKNLIDIYDQLIDFCWDRYFSIETRGFLAPYQFKTLSSSLTHARGYQGCRYRDLKKTFNNFPSSWNYQNSTFVDLGSGKGRAIYMAKEYGFKKAIGIELCSDLCAKANLNLDAENNNIKIINSDVLEVDPKLFGKEPIFFLYNSFDAHVFHKLLGNIHEHGIHARFILANPRTRDVLINEDYQLLRRIRSFDFNRIIEFYEAIKSGN